MGTNEGARPWTGVFEVCTAPNPDDPDSAEDCNGDIHLRQVDERTFVLESRLRYVGEYVHADGTSLDEEWLTVAPGEVTDLASVPVQMRWMVNTYGAHTPAAVIHDKLIPQHDHDLDAKADRYFRNLLGELGVPWVTRWIMWAGVALRTKAQNGPRYLAAIVIWLICAVVGLGLAVWAMLAGSIPLFLLSLVPMLPATVSWGGQWGFPLVSAVTLPLLLPAVVPILIVRGIGALANRFITR